EMAACRLCRRIRFLCCCGAFGHSEIRTAWRRRITNRIQRRLVHLDGCGSSRRGEEEMIGLIRRVARRIRKKAVQAVRPAIKVYAPARLRRVMGRPGAHLFAGYYDIDPFLEGGGALAHLVRTDDGEAEV